MCHENARKNPSEIVATIAGKKLLTNGLLSSKRLEEVCQKLGKGTATAEDWTLWADVYLSKEEEKQ